MDEERCTSGASNAALRCSMNAWKIPFVTGIRTSGQNPLKTRSSRPLKHPDFYALAGRGFFQQRYVKRHEIWHKSAYTQRDMAFCSSQNQTAFRPLILGGLMPAESRSFSSEKSYSPSRLICCQDTTEPFAMAWDRISRAFAAPRRCPALLRRARMPWAILRV